MDNSKQAFFELVKAGLFPIHGEGGMVHDSLFKDMDWEKVYLLAQEQSVQGLVLQGIETVQGSSQSSDASGAWLKVHGSSHSEAAKPSAPLVPKVLLLQWIGEVQIIEQRNKEMNAFVAELIEKLRENDVDALLVKGQGVAQCYEKPLWRCSGDIDLFLSNDNYQKAKSFLMPLASEIEKEYLREMHLGMCVDGWVVELHGSLYGALSSRIEQELDKVHQDTFFEGAVRSWNNNGTQVFLLKAENDVFYVFSHILQHFFMEGIGLRQICDWCRLLYTYRDSLDYGLLESRIRSSGLVSEWKAFYNLASRYLGMPDYDSQDSQARMSDQRSSAGLMVHDSRYDKKADRIMEFILKAGNMGHNRDMSHFSKYPYLIRKCVSMGRRIGDLINHARIFPLDSLRFFPRIMFNGVMSAMKGE